MESKRGSERRTTRRSTKRAPVFFLGGRFKTLRGHLNRKVINKQYIP